MNQFAPVVDIVSIAGGVEVTLTNLSHIHGSIQTNHRSPGLTPKQPRWLWGVFHKPLAQEI